MSKKVNLKNLEKISAKENEIIITHSTLVRSGQATINSLLDEYKVVIIVLQGGIPWRLTRAKLS